MADLESKISISTLASGYPGLTTAATNSPIPAIHPHPQHRLPAASAPPDAHLYQRSPPVQRSTPPRKTSSVHTPISPYIHGASRGSVSLFTSATNEPLTYTKTGRISKAKKGKKCHSCPACGRTYTRAEHLRRHAKIHEGNVLRCDFAGCGKEFYRQDLLTRHRYKHELPVSSAVVCTIPPSGYPYPVSSSPLMPFAPITSMNTGMPGIPVTSSITSSSHNETMASSEPYTGMIQENTGPYPEPWSATPYSSSSDFSPVPPDVVPPYSTETYHDRTRTPSSVSMPNNWQPPPSSPDSTTSWPERNIGNLSIKCSESYLMSPLSNTTSAPIPAYSLYPPPVKPAVDWDKDDEPSLFPHDHHITGLDQKSLQYIENYWRHFHPVYPVIHKPTFNLDTCSPLLKATMTAIGAQYSQRDGAKLDSHTIHIACQKRLQQRGEEFLSYPMKIQDMQAIFLLEVLSQYRGLRAASRLSRQFEIMYHNLLNYPDTQDARKLDDTLRLASHSGEQDGLKHWTHWVELSVRHRLHISSFILVAQQPAFLGRANNQVLVPDEKSFLPCVQGLWDASHHQWYRSIQRPQVVHHSLIDAIHRHVPLDGFQSSFILAFNYCSINPNHYLQQQQPFQPLAINLDTSPHSQFLQFSTDLIRHVPIRALLAIAGDTFILSEKVSYHAYESLKETLQHWIAELWQPSLPSVDPPIKTALKCAISLLTLAIENHSDLRSMRAQGRPVGFGRQDIFPLTPGLELPLQLAGLVLWATTDAATARYVGSPLHSSFALIERPEEDSLLLLRTAIDEIDVAMPGHSHDGTGFASDSVTLDRWQSGVMAIIHWVGLRTLGDPGQTVFPIGIKHEVTPSATNRLGELGDGIVNVLEKLAKRGWNPIPHRQW